MAQTQLNCEDKQAEQRLTLSAGAFGNNGGRANKGLIMVAAEHTTQGLIGNYLYGNRRQKRQAKKLLRRKGLK